MNKETMISDVLDYWCKKGEEPKPIKKNDIVVLHDWGNDTNRVIAVARLRWDTESHCWDFDYFNENIDIDSYDQWRTSPKVIGYRDKDGRDIINDDDYANYNHNWDMLVEDELKKSQLKSKKKELKHKLNEIKKDKISKEEAVSKLNLEIEELNQKLKEVK